MVAINHRRAFTVRSVQVQRIAGRIGRSLERSAFIARGIENAYLTFDPGEDAPINSLLGASITYRIATGPREGRRSSRCRCCRRSLKGRRVFATFGVASLA
jgi:hypothetical protein